ncbi:zinc finger protein 862-like [Ambystoma mexicanum]|uniref:zinc finger protein 862-like n=1 Tax=Ambystoma mexicanum TaxID=8296 RepID=UPI0037E86484
MALRVETLKKWQREVNSKYDWLQFESNDSIIVDRIFCSLCATHETQIRAMRNYSAAFIKGIAGSSLKKDNVNKHFFSEMHQRAMSFEKLPPAVLLDNYNSEPISRRFADAEALERQRVAKLIDIAYSIAKMEIPFANFPHIARLEARHGVDLGQVYITEIKCKEFTDSIGRVMEQEFVIALQQATYFSLLIDSTPTTKGDSLEMMYVLFVDGVGLPSVRFLGLKDVKNVNSADLKNTILTAFLELGIDVGNKLVGFMRDGTGHNLSMKKEVSDFMKQNSPFLISVHCLSHHLEMAVRDMFKDTEFESIMDMLQSLHSFYQSNPNRLSELKPLAEIMEETFTKSEKVNGTRWVQHRNRACKALLQLFPLIVSHLEGMADEKSENTFEKSRHQACLGTLKSLKFVLHLLLFIEVLDPISKLSLSIQKESVDFLYATALLEQFYSTIERIANGTLYCALSNLLSDAEKDPKSVFFNGIRLTSGSQDLEGFRKSVPSYTEDIANCVKNRLDEFHKEDIFQCLKMLDVNIWPANRESLAEYGVKELYLFIGHFERLLKMNNVDLSQLAREWDLVKGFRLKSLTQLSKQELWQCVLTNYREKFPNLYHMICILLSFPLSSSILERGYLSLERMRSDCRNTFGEKSLEYLVRIIIEGVEPEVYDPRPAVSLFFSQPCSSSLFSYGNRISESVLFEEEFYEPPEKKYVL